MKVKIFFYFLFFIDYFNFFVFFKDGTISFLSKDVKSKWIIKNIYSNHHSHNHKLSEGISFRLQNYHRNTFLDMNHFENFFNLQNNSVLNKNIDKRENWQLKMVDNHSKDSLQEGSFINLFQQGIFNHYSTYKWEIEVAIDDK